MLFYNDIETKTMVYGTLNNPLPLQANIVKPTTYAGVYTITESKYY